MCKYKKDFRYKETHLSSKSQKNPTAYKQAQFHVNQRKMSFPGNVKKANFPERGKWAVAMWSEHTCFVGK